MFLCWLKSSRALSFTRLLLSVDERKKRARSVIGKEWKTEGREKWRACKHLFKCPTRPLAENPFLSKCQMSKRQKVRRCSMVSHGSICLLQYARAKPSDWRKRWSKLSKHTLYQERLPFLWKPGQFRGEFKSNISFRWKFSGKKVIPFEVLPFPRFYRHFSFRKRFQVQYHLSEIFDRNFLTNGKRTKSWYTEWGIENNAYIPGSTTPSLSSPHAVFAQLFLIRFPHSWTLLQMYVNNKVGNYTLQFPPEGTKSLR